MRRWLRIAAGIAGPGPRASRLRQAVAGRTVLVTGASEGIGAATARRLAAAGATVLLVARTAERLDEVAADIAKAGGTAHPHPCDLSDPEAARALAHDLLDRYRRIDVVVSNAGRSIRRSVADTADRFHDITRTANLNYLGPVQLLLVLLPAMRAAGGGRIVNVSTASLAGPLPQWSAYLASKAAFDMWLRCAAIELRADRVRVSTVYIGLTRTRMIAPTAAYRRVPAMSPDEAAAVVCRAVAHLPHSTWPWWARAAAVASATVPDQQSRVLSTGLHLAETAARSAAIARTGLLRPAALTTLGRTARRFGPTLATALLAGPPDGTAVIDADGALGRRDLIAAARRFAAGAAADLGVAAGDRVGVACGPHRGFVVATAGLGLLGADAVLLPTDLPAGRRAAVLAAHRVSVLVHDGTGDWPTHHAARSDDSDHAGDRPVRHAAWSDVSGDGRPAPPRTPGRLVVLTSGTTGAPRGVHRPLPLRVLLGPVATHLRLIPVRRGEPIVVAPPPHHGYGLTYLAAGLLLGAPVVLGATDLLAALAEHRAGVLFALPTQLRRLVGCPVPGLPALRAVVSGAAPLPPDLVEDLRAMFGERVFNLYGTTEAGWAAIATPADLRAAPGTVGRPPHGVSIRVTDPAGDPLPPGHSGEVQVRGWHPDGAWRPTGDIGRLDLVGRLFLLGRTDDMISSGGENVYPGPVLAALLAHPAVQDAVVRGVPDTEFGQRLRAWVEPAPGARLDAAELHAWLRERLARAERPRDLIVVARLPRTATGKPLPPDHPRS